MKFGICKGLFIIIKQIWWNWDRGVSGLWSCITAGAGLGSESSVLVYESCSYMQCILRMRRVEEYATLKYVTLAYRLFSVLSSWKTVDVERSFLWTLLSAGGQISKRNSVVTNSFLRSFINQEDWLWSQEETRGQQHTQTNFITNCHLLFLGLVRLS